MSVVGFDFGTTNSLVSVVKGNRAINFLDEQGMPVPSVVCYEGERTLVGREAKERASSAGLGIVGNTVRSAKRLLGRESVFVDGVERKPVEIVRDIVKHVLEQAARSGRRADLGKVESAVVTIPVTMEGYRRVALRDAFRMAGIGIRQFVHEPLAALYGHFRSAPDLEAMCRQYDRQLMLVADWGGGTLDITLCRLLDGMLYQVANAGSDEVGGDFFDEAIRATVMDEALRGRKTTSHQNVQPDAMTRLLHACERAKIDLSSREKVVIYLSSFFREGETDIQYDLTRRELESTTGPLVDAGVEQIKRVLDRAGYASAQVALCLAVGGMASMPAVRSRLRELFGVQRVHVSDRSASLIAEGAAWVAADSCHLHLAKDVELVLARGSFLSLVPAGTAMPSEGEVCTESFHLYCVDPRDGFAKFELQAPIIPGRRPLRDDPRLALCDFAVKVDRKAVAFRERLELDVSIDDNLILTARARSLDVQNVVEAEVHDLEFALRLPYPGDGQEERSDTTAVPRAAGRAGALTARSNVADRVAHSLVPGEFLHTYRPEYFDVRNSPPGLQVHERLYYERCAGCGRASSDPLCRC